MPDELGHRSHDPEEGAPETSADPSMNTISRPSNGSAAPTVEKDWRTASGKPLSRSSRDRQSHPEAVAAAPRTAQKSMTINTDAPTSR
jgi:hypothetical protein